MRLQPTMGLLLYLSFQLATVSALTTAPEAKMPSTGEIFITGHPSLPSPESLGLTPAVLYNVTRDWLLAGRPIPSRGSVEKRWDDDCDAAPPERPPCAGIEATFACYYYLDALGTTPCEVTWGESYFCHAEPIGADALDANIIGFRVGPSTSSHCRDVASAVLWSINNCYNYYWNQGLCPASGDFVGGRAAAWGNGDLIVEVSSGCAFVCN
jgi:hypothetical protein